MARSKKHRTNIDPFNAGEPIMPWDEPSTQHTFNCELDDEAYCAPHKEAPAAKAGTAPAGRKARGWENPALRNAASKQMPQNSPAQMPPASQQTGVRLPSSAPAAQTSNNVRGIFKLAIIFIVAVSLFISLAGIVVSCSFSGIANNVISEIDSAFNDDSDDYSYEAEAFDESTASAEQIEVARFSEEYVDEALHNNTELSDAITQSLNDKFEAYLGYSMEELGLDTSAYAQKAIDSADFMLSSAYTCDGSGTTYYYCTTLDYHTFHYDFIDVARDYLDDEGISSVDALNNEQKEQLQQLFDDTLEDFDETTENYVSLSFDLKDGTWVADESYCLYELCAAFDVYIDTSTTDSAADSSADDSNMAAEGATSEGLAYDENATQA